jgi:hypothetical protein
MKQERQGRLMDNIAEATTGVPQETLLRQIGHLLKADPDPDLVIRAPRFTFSQPYRQYPAPDRPVPDDD